MNRERVDMNSYCNNNGRDPYGYSLYLIDMGNVVIKNIHVIEKIAIHYGIAVDELSEDYAKYNFPLMDGTLSSDVYWRHVETLFGVTIHGDPLADFFKPVWNPVIVSLVKKLRERGKTVVCASNTYGPHWEYMKEQGFTNGFDRLYASHEMGITKPTRQFFEYILTREQKSPLDSFFIDDYEENIVASRKLGITALHYTDDSHMTADEKLISLFGDIFTQS
jgi:glucose-1-phosphatase